MSVIQSYYDNRYIIILDNKVITVYDKKGNIIKNIYLKNISNNTARLNISLSNICNLKCSYCSEGNYINKPPQVISVSDSFMVIDSYIKYILDNCTDYKIDTIILSFDYGGEPVLKLDILEKISEYFKKICSTYSIKSIVQMTTNCAWDSLLLDRVCSALDEIIVSIDGYEELHNKYRINSSNYSFNTIIYNAKKINERKKMKYISIVITMDCISHYKEYINFFIDNFYNSYIKISPVLFRGSAIKNNIDKIQYVEWNNFVKNILSISNDKIKILDTKPEKTFSKLYLYGCEYIKLIDWFFWTNGKITCCTDRDYDKLTIGLCKNHNLEIYYDLMNKLIFENNVENIETCKDCIAKYYCSGGCVKFRNSKLNCEKRINKYLNMIIDSI